jgi:hypothetical protein
MRQQIVGEHKNDEAGNPAGGRTTGKGINIHWQNGPLGREPDEAAVAVATCPEPGNHDRFRYCPCCPWTEDFGRKEPNGAFVEGVIAAAIDRLEYYQNGNISGAHGNALACRENALAITKLQEALHWLDHRTADREARKVEGTHAT